MSNLNVPLSSDQDEIVSMYQELTGIDDYNLCRDTLIRHNWDLEAAVQDQLNIREGRPSVFALDNNPPVVVTDIARQNVFVSERRTEPWPWYYGGAFGFLASLMYRTIYDTVISIIRLVRAIIWPAPRFPLTDPVGDVLRHVRQFEENYGRNHPVFYQGSYGQALSDAKNELKFLLVHLHSENIPESISFCRNTLTNSDVIAFTNENNIIFWSCSINSGEGQRVVDTIKPSIYPFVGVIVLRDNKMVIAARFHGNIPAEEFVNRLMTIIVDNEHSLLSTRAERIERSINQSLRAQQDEAYRESLLADQEKERKRNEKEERVRLQQQEEEELIEQEQQQKLDIENEKKTAADKVPLEPASTDTNIVTIVFKLPNGNRLERRFLSTHTLTDVYNFVFCLPDISDEFEIFTNFPKRILNCSTDAKTTLEDAGLSPKEVLFIYDLKV